MIDYHRFCQIKHLHAHEGLNASQIAQAVSLDRRTVAYWLTQEHFRPRKPRPPHQQTRSLQIRHCPSAGTPSLFGRAGLPAPA